ncbi:copper chaperone CopZ [Carnobacterium gallinarum]|uniref:copper chaperone CopZ n=1 Tax=Carnobacterium gallinarum TaxID=2749 RepID=UPI00054D8FED|nr:copper chaperone CopZ [Carnobacterium gallinarum]
MEKMNVKITGMSCEHCVKRVEEAINGLAGIDKVKVHLKKGEAKIKYDSSLVTSKEIAETITNTGYEAVLI